MNGKEKMFKNDVNNQIKCLGNFLLKAKWNFFLSTIWEKNNGFCFTTPLLIESFSIKQLTHICYIRITKLVSDIFYFQRILSL